jgi:hypothetical protein
MTNQAEQNQVSSQHQHQQPLKVRTGLRAGECDCNDNCSNCVKGGAADIYSKIYCQDLCKL